MHRMLYNCRRPSSVEDSLTMLQRVSTYGLHLLLNYRGSPSYIVTHTSGWVLYTSLVHFPTASSFLYPKRECLNMISRYRKASLKWMCSHLSDFSRALTTSSTHNTRFKKHVYSKHRHREEGFKPLAARDRLYNPLPHHHRGTLRLFTNGRTLYNFYETAKASDSLPSRLRCLVFDPKQFHLFSGHPSSSTRLGRFH